MNQEVRVRMLQDNKWIGVLSSYNLQNKNMKATGEASIASNRNILMRIRPYVAVQMHIQDNLVTNVILSVGNPSPKFAKNLVGRMFEITLGYSNIKNGLFKVKEFVVFIGLVVQPPYYTDGGQGTDQILHIPLVMGALPIVDKNKDVFVTYEAGVTKLKDVLNQLFKQNKYSSIKADPVFYSKDLENAYMKSSASINLASWGFSQVQRHLEQTEGVKIFTNNTNTLYVADNKSLKDEMNNKQSVSGNNAGVIFNQYYKRSNREDSVAYVSTYLKTKYAVIGLDNSLNLELAFVLPNLVGKRYCVLQNIGQNIQIYNSLGDADTNKPFYISKQDIVFSTFGDSSHKISLLASPTESNLNSTLSVVQEFKE